MFELTHAIYWEARFQRFHASLKIKNDPRAILWARGIFFERVEYFERFAGVVS